MVSSFAELQLRDDVLRAIESLGFEEPTPVQAETIPHLLQGRDVVAQAQTGTGKTAAFALPIVQRVDIVRREVQALVLAPTRELAVQVAAAMDDMGRTSGLTVLPIYGGQAYDRQLRGLKSGVHVVVGTPGRVMDHIRRGTLNLSTVKTVVLDEADEMLDMGFVEDIEFILSGVPAERQIALFSATLPRRIDALIRQYLRNPERVTVANDTVTASQTRQMYVETHYRDKVEALTRILDIASPRSAIVFCRTKREVDDLSETLHARGYTPAAIHGDINQAQRERLLLSFRDGRAALLIATEVAARGLDIPDVTHVFNYDIPHDADAYIHRIGRTGRMGRKGDAVTFVTPHEMRKLRLIERQIRQNLVKMRVPSTEDIALRRQENFRAALVRTIESGAASRYADLIGALAQTHDPRDVAAAAVYLANGGSDGRHDEAIPPPESDHVERSDSTPHDAAPVRTAPNDAALDHGAPAQNGMTRLHLDTGREQGATPRDLVSALTTEAGIPAPTIGTIEMSGDFTLVDLETDAATVVLERAALLRLNGRDVHVTKAQTTDRQSSTAADRPQAPRKWRNGTPLPGRPTGPHKRRKKTTGSGRPSGALKHREESAGPGQRAAAHPRRKAAAASGRPPAAQKRRR